MSSARAPKEQTDIPAVLSRLVALRRYLQLNTDPDKLPGREKELDSVKKALRDALLADRGLTMYICGATGTGKTAVLRQVLKQLMAEVREMSSQQEAEGSSDDEDKQPVQKKRRIKHCYINAMKITSPKEALEKIWGVCKDYEVRPTTTVRRRRRAATAETSKAASDDADDNLDNIEAIEDTKGRGRGATQSKTPKSVQALIVKLRDIFCSAKSAEIRPYIVIVIDELDFMVSKNQDEIYSVFDWAMRPESKLCVIGVANTINLLDSLLPKVASRVPEKNRVQFSVYSGKQIESILGDRLSKYTDLFDKNALALCGARIASGSGDIRVALNACKRAAEIAEDRIEDIKEQQQKERRRLTAPAATAEASGANPFVVSTADMNSALEDMHKDRYPLSNLPLYHKILLMCITEQQQNSSDSLLGFDGIVARFQNIISLRFSLPFVKVNDVLSMCDLLAMTDLIAYKENSTDRWRGIELLAPVMQIQDSMKQDPQMAPYFQRTH